MSTFIPPLDFSRSPDSFVGVKDATQAFVTREDSSIISSTACSDSLHRSGTFVPSTVTTTASSYQIAASRRILEDTTQCERASSVAWKLEIDALALVRGSRSKLVKRAPFSRSQKSIGAVSKGKFAYYRCDIHVLKCTRRSQIEVACKDIVKAAGGQIIDDYVYPGGFLYSLPAHSTNPLRDEIEIVEGCYIAIGPWEPFGKLHANPEVTSMSAFQSAKVTSQLTAGLMLTSNHLPLHAVGGTAKMSRTKTIVGRLLKSYQKLTHFT